MSLSAVFLISKSTTSALLNCPLFRRNKTVIAIFLDASIHAGRSSDCRLYEELHVGDVHLYRGSVHSEGQGSDLFQFPELFTEQTTQHLDLFS